MHKRHKDPRATFKKEHANKDEEALHKTVVGSGVSAMALLEFIIEHEIPRTATVADVVADVILPGTGRAPKVRKPADSKRNQAAAAVMHVSALCSRISSAALLSVQL